MVPPTLQGRRVLITGAARGIGAALAQRLHEKGARVALVGIEEDALAATAASVDAPHWVCDVTDRERVDEVIDAAAAALGGLDVVIANAGVAAQLPIVDGDPAIFEATNAVNVLGCYYTLRAAGRHIAHDNGYALAVSSMGAVVHMPLMGAYSASKAGVEALGNTLRTELASSGAKVGVAYFAELDTEMTTRGFGTEAAKSLLGDRAFTGVTPLSVGIDALERGITQRSRRVVAPWWGRVVLPIRELAQPAMELLLRSPLARKRVTGVLEVARNEKVELTTVQENGR